MRNVLLWLLGALLPASLLAVGVVGPTFAQPVEAPSNLTVGSSKQTFELQPLDVTLTWQHSAVEVVFELERGFQARFQSVSEVVFAPLAAPEIRRNKTVYTFFDAAAWDLGDPPCYRVRAVTDAGTSEWSVVCEFRPPTTGPGGDPTPVVPPVGTGLKSDPDSFSPVAILMLIATGGGVVMTLLLLIGLRER